MPALDYEIKDQIHDLLEDEYITHAEARLLENFFSCPSRKEAAQRSGIKPESFVSAISRMTRDGILIRVSRGVLKLTEDVGTIKRQSRNTLPPPMEPPLQMSEAERKWMLANYKSSKRAEAALKLGRSKYDINRMAIKLGIDQKN